MAATDPKLILVPRSSKTLCLVWCCLMAFAFPFLRAEPAFQFHTIDKLQGLASSVVYDIAQDQDGFVWFATEDGLQRYDGFEFVDYRHSRLDDHSISSNVVRTVLVDRAKRLWVGTNNGLNLYQEKYDNFVRILAPPEGSYNLPSNQIRALAQSSDGNIWIGTAEGLTRLNPTTFEISNFKQDKVRTIYEDKNQNLWVGTLGSGLFLFDRSTQKFKKIPIKSTNKMQQERARLILDIKQDSTGRIFLATWGDGVFTLDSQNQQLNQYPIDLPSNKVRSIIQDKEGKIWFGTKKGIVIQDLKSKTLRVINSDNRTVMSPKADEVFKIFQARDMTVWIGTYGGGVSRHVPMSRMFESYGFSNDPKMGLIDPLVYAMSENKNGDLWIGTESGIISKFSPLKETFIHYKLRLNESSFTMPIIALTELDKAWILIGTNSGLFLFNKERKILKRNTESKNFRKTGAVRFIEQDKNNVIWVGYQNMGIRSYQFNSKKQTLKDNHFDILIQAPQAMINYAPNKYLVGSQRFGIFKIVLAGDSYKKIKIPGTDNIDVLGISRDWEGKVWVATWSQGIKILSPNGVIRSLDENSGLPNDTVYSILPDESTHSIWATTNKGMVSIKANSLKTTRFSFYDGLQGDEFNRPGLMSKRGYIYFGGINGFNRFLPSNIKNHIYVEKAKIIGLTIANSQVKMSEYENTLLSRSMLVSKHITLTFFQAPFAFKFTSPQFVKPAEIQFRYRLIGLSDEWIITSKNSRKATYTNIVSGDYIFELQVRNINSDWLAQVQRKVITIKPAWWLSFAAKFIYYSVLWVFIMLIYHLNREYALAKYINNRYKDRTSEQLNLSLWGGGNELWDWDLSSGKISRSEVDEVFHIDCTRLSRDLHELEGYIHPHDVEKVKVALRSHLDGTSEFFDTIYRIKDQAIGWRWIQDRAKAVKYNLHGVPLRLTGTQKDITELQQKNEEILRLGQTFTNTSDGVWIRNEHWELIDCNPAYEKTTGYSIKESLGSLLDFPEHPEQTAGLLDRIKKHLTRNKTWKGEVWASKKNKEAFPQSLTIDMVKDDDGHVKFYVGVFTDISYLIKSQKELLELANFDKLTGLVNRSNLYDRLSQNVKKSELRKDRFAVIHIDINNLKRFNDTYDHNIGDEIIRKIAARMSETINETDTLARLSGDEFILIRDPIKSSAQVAAFVEQLMKKVEQPLAIRDQHLQIKVTIGISMYPEDAQTTDQLINNAANALKIAKAEIESDFTFFSESLNKKAKKRLVLENALHKSVENNQLHLAYQPKINLDTGKVVGMEALARWHHQSLGHISPVEFIPIAEECGLIHILGRQLLKKAIQQTKQWVDLGIMRGRMSVNLSAYQFWHRDLVNEIEQLLQEEALEPHYLELELTESACVQEVANTVNQMHRLRDLGIHLSLDDFGTGYSSLAQLKTLPLDTLKIDRSFVLNIHKKPEDRNIVRAIIDIAKSLGLAVVVEGIETREQCEYLWLENAKIIQGYLFSKPVDAPAMVELLKKQWPKASYLSNKIIKLSQQG